MRKIIKITESQLKQMVKRMIMEQSTYYHSKEQTDGCTNKQNMLQDFYNGKTVRLQNVNYKITGTDLPRSDKGPKPQMFFILKPLNQGEDKLLEILCTGKSTLFNSWSTQSGILKTAGNFKIQNANYDGKQVDVTNESSVKSMFPKFKLLCDSCLKSKIDFTMSNKNNNTEKITESQLKQMVKRMIMEQPTTSKYTRENPLKPKNDPYEYAYENNVLYTKKKGETNWREISRKNLGDNYKFDSAIGAIKNKFGDELGMSNLPDNSTSKTSSSTTLPTKNTYTRNSPLRPKNDPYEYANENGNIFTKKREGSEWVELPSSQMGKNVIYDIARNAIVRKHGTELNIMK